MTGRGLPQSSPADTWFVGGAGPLARLQPVTEQVMYPHQNGGVSNQNGGLFNQMMNDWAIEIIQTRSVSQLLLV